MKLAALFSGGKDSTYSVFRAIQLGHTVDCLITIAPHSEDSMLLHHPNIWITKLQSESMRIPHIYTESKKSSTEHEEYVLHKILPKARDDYGVQGILHGGISSRFQKRIFEDACSGLETVSPVWDEDPSIYMRQLLRDGFRFMLSSVSSGGLDEQWLGRILTESDLTVLESLSVQYGFNLNFEGGEAETLVIDCPLFSSPIQIHSSVTMWDGYRGRFEIEEAELDMHAR